MKICFSCPLESFKPKGNVLQFFIMLQAIDREVERLSPRQQEDFVLHCVLPFRYVNGMGGFHFRHVRFYQSDELNRKIIRLDRSYNYDFIFIRGRTQAREFVKKKPSLGKKLLFLSIHYNLKDPIIMHKVDHLFKNCRMIFFQTVPNARRYRDYLERKTSYSAHELDRKIHVLPQFVENFSSDEHSSIQPNSPLDLIVAGVIRPRYGLNKAVRAIRLIRKETPQAKLHVLYPSIVGRYRRRAQELLRSPGVVDHGQKSMWQTKRMILKSGIGLALIYDSTPDKNPSHSYLSRVLEYMGLGVPVITTKTVGNVHLLGENYPLFVRDEHDILECYRKLSDPAYYQEMCRYVSSRGKHYLAENAVKPFWNLLLSEWQAMNEQKSRVEN
ncbi:glycosyltransferase family 4 protein [Brevibacillus composti]|uniref:Glycosyltransferase family 4 protein n=1 Tax=Brevibacillus composti TaxID=2796470 RepID=A0A7T5EN05_9BACL|nr:glycosyltransferase family 4 protein [Brevibacillus composti]QQE75531.1 glycosyltransferase family 4 protein [Brevibacillus composti]QUO42557.1 glycosyltransferase family 4 protein [Brevibacillus composti]